MLIASTTPVCRTLVVVGRRTPLIIDASTYCASLALGVASLVSDELPFLPRHSWPHKSQHAGSTQPHVHHWCSPIQNNPEHLHVCFDKVVSHNSMSQDYKLSLGQIVRTLRSDYHDFFHRTPDWEIYDEGVVLELGRPFPELTAIRGKPSYRRALEIIRRLACTAVSDGWVACRIYRSFENDYDLHAKCEWHGRIRATPFRISAISLYSVRRQVPPDLALSHKIYRHSIELVEVHPPRIRELIAETLKPKPNLQPGMACHFLEELISDG